MTTEQASRTEQFQSRRRRFIPRGLSTGAPIVVDHAHGAEVWDTEGRRFLDFAGGIGTLNVGHTPERVVQAIQEQAAKLIHMCFQVGAYEPYLDLAERLAGLVPGPSPKKTLLLNSGAEAVENAVKIARAATGRPAVIAFDNAFHGRTTMAMSLTGKERPYKVGFGPFAPEVYHARFPYRYRCVCGGAHDTCPVETGEDLERFFATTVAAASVAAIIVEPVQGEGGFVVAPFKWLRALRRICDREGIVLICDEVQTGFGRTGTMFALEQAGIESDLYVLAKSLAAGMPLSAVVGKAEVMDAPGPGGIGGTYAGNPVACAAALAVLDVFEDQDLVSRARRVGEVVRERLDRLAESSALVGEARGLGAMQAIELVTDRDTRNPARAETADIVHRCLDAGLIVLKAGLYDNVIRILVPLVVKDDQLREGLDILESTVMATS